MILCCEQCGDYISRPNRTFAGYCSPEHAEHARQARDERGREAAAARRKVSDARREKAGGRVHYVT